MTYPVRSLVCLAALAACGTDVTIRPPIETPDEKTFDDYADEAEGLDACIAQPNPPESVVMPGGPEFEDGSCYVMARPPLHDDTTPRWMTMCRGTTCFCIESEMPVCACTTELPWCDEVTPSCCPPPFP